MSADLVWMLTRNNSSFLVKRNGVQFSREKGNLLNKNSFKYSGVANAKTVDVSAAPKGVVISLRKKGVPASKPGKSVQTATISKGSRRSINKSVKNMAKNYRADLTHAALARVGRIIESQKAPKPQKVRKARGAKKL
ncbi:hypothetical protein HK101_009236 [Irineochytrium annulatum]|nr:hypothetical protein HK101_009236 [Irineochytrium annulatum]